MNNYYDKANDESYQEIEEFKFRDCDLLSFPKKIGEENMKRLWKMKHSMTQLKIDMKGMNEWEKQL